MKKILITGSTGMLGSELIKFFLTIGQFDVYSLGRKKIDYLPVEKQLLLNLIDIQNHKDKISSLQFDFIIHTAAITDLNYCEQNPEEAFLINSQITGVLASCFNSETHFIYISTDSVFNGLNFPFKEIDIPDPLNVYSKSKFKGELYARQYSKGRCTIVRTNIYGFNTPVKNSLFEWALKQWNSGNIINGYDDVIFNAVYTHQLAKALHNLVISENYFPILNIGSSEIISKWAFLNKILESTDFDRKLLRKVKSTEFVSKIERPLNTSLSVDLFNLNFEPLTFEDGIKQCIKKFKTI
jgi:dTDP-4-dehydrorhamnose reductase